MMYPVKPIRMPADLKGVSNGKLPARLLRKVGPTTLHHLASRAWAAMQKAAARDGITLGQVGDYRPYSRQEALFLDRYSKKPTTRVPQVTRRWNGETWYLKKGKAPSATPGTSNHGWGLAIDVSSVTHGGRVEWLLQNAGRFGFTWEVADPKDPNFEAWHIRYVSGDRVPKAVKAEEA